MITNTNAVKGSFGSQAAWTDHTVAPPLNQRLLDTTKNTIEIKVSIYLLVCKGLSIDDVGVGQGTTGSWC